MSTEQIRNSLEGVISTCVSIQKMLALPTKRPRQSSRKVCAAGSTARVAWLSSATWFRPSAGAARRRRQVGSRGRLWQAATRPWSRCVLRSLAWS